MLLMTYQLVSAVNQSVKTLNTVLIWNDSTGKLDLGNYKYKITIYYDDPSMPDKEINGILKDWPRLDKTALELLSHILSLRQDDIKMI